MFRISQITVVLLGGWSLSALSAETGAVHARIPVAQELVLRESCIECHGPKKQKGKFRVDELDFSLSSVEAAERWRKVLRQIRSGEMPPEAEPRPNPALVTEFLQTVDHSLSVVRKELTGRPGQPLVRRLNRREYKNTIRDLVGAEVSDTDLPEDDDSGTFDTARKPGEILPAQLEQYQVLARKFVNVLFAAGASAPVQPKVLKLHSEPEEKANKAIFAQLKSVDEKYERNVKGAKEEYEKRHQYLTDYLALPYKDTGVYLTMVDGHREDHISVNDTWPAGRYLLRIRLAAVDGSAESRRFIEVGQRGSDAGNFTVLSGHHVTGTVDLPQTLEVPINISPLGSREYAIRERRQNTPAAEMALWTEAFKLNGTGPKPAVWIDWVELEGPIGTVSGNSVGAAYAQIFFKGPPVIEVLARGASYQQNLEYAREILQRFCVRAFRGKVPSAEYLNGLMAAYETRRGGGATFEDAIKSQLTAILTAPGFLVFGNTAPVAPVAQDIPKSIPPGVWHMWSDPLGARVEAELLSLDGDFVTVRLKSGATHRLNLNKLVPGDRVFAEQAHSLPAIGVPPLDLAYRLSYLLWSGPPDEALLGTAAKGELLNPVILAQQVNRLLLDPRSESFVTSFVQPWLELSRMNAFKFSSPAFRHFDDSIQIAAKNEVYRTVEHLLRGGGSLKLLLKSDFVLVNALLADYYGLKGVSGDEFRPVPLPPDSPRGGLLGMAAIHAIGSNGERSSPVDRGAWVLRKLLNEPLAPAPTGVPKISRLDDQLLSTQERLKAHQELSQCVACHRKIDPIGMGLENFDAVGRWRKEDVYEKAKVGRKVWPIEAAGTLYKGPSFKDYFELRNILESKSEQFARGFAEVLVEYALGRPSGFLEVDLVESILSQARQKDFSANEFVQALVRSPEFWTR